MFSWCSNSIILSISLFTIIKKLFNIFSSKDISSTVIFTISILNSLIGIYIMYQVGNANSSAFGIVLGIISWTLVLLGGMEGSKYIKMQELIAHAKNPKNAIGFETKYLKGITIPLSVHSNNENINS